MASYGTLGEFFPIQREESTATSGTLNFKEGRADKTKRKQGTIKVTPTKEKGEEVGMKRGKIVNTFCGQSLATACSFICFNVGLTQ